MLSPSVPSVDASAPDATEQGLVDMSPPSRRPAVRSIALASLLLGVSIGAGLSMAWFETRPMQVAVTHSPAGPPPVITDVAVPIPSVPADGGLPPARIERDDEAPLPTVEASPDLTRAQAEAPAATLSVADAGVGSDVVDRELAGRSSTFSPGSDVVFWTLITGGGPGEAVHHVWLHDGSAVSRVPLPVEGPLWRTYSRFQLTPGVEGDWIVEAHDLDGRVLASQRFQTRAQ